VLVIVEQADRWSTPLIANVTYVTMAMEWRKLII